MSKIARFRTCPAPPRVETPPPYRAFEVMEGNPASGTTRMPLRLALHTANGICTAGFYAAITTVQYAENGNSIVLQQRPRIAIMGRHLQPLAQAITAGICVRVTQIREGETAPEGAPVVTQIAYHEGDPPR